MLGPVELLRPGQQRSADDGAVGLAAIGRLGGVAAARAPTSGVAVPFRKRAVHLDGAWTTAPVFEQGRLGSGAELDGRVTIDDVGLGRMASANKPFIGSALRQRPELQREDRARLVGIFPKDRSKRFNAGPLLFSAGVESGFGEGWITAAAHSPALGHWIGLGFISGGLTAWQDKPVVATDPTRNEVTEVEIVSPHMYDPEGARLHV